jgi:mRNA interferase MazF
VVIQRGEIWWAVLDDPVGSEPGFRRPVVILQSDAFNRSRIGTTIGAAITSNIRLADAPGNVLIPKSASGLLHDSVTNVSQLVTLDRSQLTSRARRLPAPLLLAIDRGLRLVLDL